MHIYLESSNTHYKVCANSCQQSASEKQPDKIETTNQFNNLTWVDLTVIDNERKAVREFNVKALKYKDLHAVRSQLKVKGVKSSMKEQMVKRLVTLHQIEVKYDKILETPDPALTRNEPRCPYRLLNILFSDAFC